MRDHLRKGLGLEIGLGVCLAGAAFAPAASAQETAAPAASAAFPDVPANHWAYEAVRRLSDQGYVRVYADGSYLGDRSLTRYEFATIVDRILQTLAQVRSATPDAAAPAVHPTQDDLNTIQVLVDTFKTQLADIQSDVAKGQADITALRAEVGTLRKDVLDAKEAAGKAQATANSSYGSGAKRKFTISGYIQARYITPSKSNSKDFPAGTPADYNPVNGTYERGTAGSTFAVRRTRIKFAGEVTANTRYAIQIDTGAGASNAVTGKEAYIVYTLGDGSDKNLSITAGQFQNPFGYDLPLSSSLVLSGERPLAFNEATLTGGPFSGQDFDRGITLGYGHGPVKYTAAFVNGTGTSGGTDTNRQVDRILRVAFKNPKPGLSGGVSYYDGALASKYASGPLTGFRQGDKQLLGVDAQLAFAHGAFLQSEYIGGKFDQRAYYASPDATALTTAFIPGNKISGYYVQGGYTWGLDGRHPFTAGAMYDVFNRAASGPASSSSYDDVNLGYGVLYNLDPQTRLRFWYNSPSKVTHLAGTASPDKLGLFTSELLVKF